MNSPIKYKRKSIIEKMCWAKLSRLYAYKCVKEWMGHSDISTTQEFYTQVDKDHEANATRLIQNLLGTGRKK